MTNTIETMKGLKNRWRKNESGTSLKVWTRKQVTERTTEESVRVVGRAWFALKGKR